MKETFIAKRFAGDAHDLLQKIHAVMATYAAQGYDLSLRQLYYQLVAADAIPHDRAYKFVSGKWVKGEYGVDGASTNAEPNYKWIGDIVSDARLAGKIDWDAIEDRGRQLVTNSHWTSPAEILQSCIHSFAIDKWLNQDNYVELMVEKQALEGVLIPVCADLDIPFTSNKGYSSSSALYSCGKRFEGKMREGKKCFIIYLGDHDPSGIDMTRDVLHRINLFANVIDGDMFMADGGDHAWGNGEDVYVRRVALNIEQVRKLRPPENPAKLTDSRADKYIERFGRSSWELDAIEPAALAKLVKDAVGELINNRQWVIDLKHENAMKDELRAFAEKSKFK